MLCDLDDSVALFERLGAESFARSIESYRLMCRDQVLRHGGIVGYFRGDCMLACFGFPFAHPDFPGRAVCAALGIVGAVKDNVWDADMIGGQRFQLRIGIDTGSVTVGQVRKDDSPDSLEVIGRPLNVAARLQCLAEPNQIIVSDMTASLADKKIRFRRLGDQIIRGVSDPVAIFTAEL